MADFVRIDGLEKVLAAFADAPEIIRDEAQTAVERALDPIRRDLADYPPPRPGQRYRRTGTLRRGWLSAKPRPIASVSGAISARLVNSTPYTRYVQGDGTQAWMHAGRWQTVGDVTERHERRIEGEIEQAMRRAAHRMTTE